MRGPDPSNTFFSLVQQGKGNATNTINRQVNTKLFAALDAYPHHAFSPGGRRNVCRRFGLTDEQLEGTLIAYERPGEYANEAERRAACLAQALRVIEAVISPSKRKRNQKATGGAGQC